MSEEVKKGGLVKLQIVKCQWNLEWKLKVASEIWVKIETSDECYFADLPEALEEIIWEMNREIMQA